jgi:hypothetical protein
VSDDNLFLTTELDEFGDEVQDRFFTALSHPGVILYDPDNDSFIFTDTSQDGKLTAKRLASNLTLGQMVLDKGIIRLAQEARRGGPTIAARGFTAAYERFISRLPHVYPDRLSFPRVSGLYRLPAVVRDESGRLVQAWPGHHRERRLLFTNGMVQPQEVEACDTSYPTLKRWMSAIEFTDEVYRGNLMGYILSCLCRPVLPQFPFLVVDATSRKQGKTTVADAIAYFLTGETVAPITHTGDEQELEKRIASACGLPGPNIVYLDNIRPKRGQSGVIRSQFLAAAATSPTVKVRPVYGKRAEPVDFPITMLTMNEAVVESDLHDRSVRLVLTGKAGRYFDPNPLAYAKTYRHELQCEAVHLLQSLDMAGAFDPVTRMGDWEEIATKAAQALGLSCNYDPDAVDTPDAAVKELVSLVSEMAEENELDPTFPELAERLILNREALPELFSLIRRTNATTNARRGYALRKFMGGLEERCLCIDGKRVRFMIEHDSKKCLRARLEEV